MDSELYERFVEAKNKGLKRQLTELANQFIASFNSQEEKEVWVREFLENGGYGHRIRHEIYRDLVFPVLLAGYKRKDAWSTFWLAKTTSNLHDLKQFHSAIENKGAIQLLTEAYNLSPSPDVRKELLEKYLAWISW
ncbi:MAG: hypothetical protein KY445_07930 [Armatimonadetes bacterium]|nr:hypothetical protein [Armatimonadota bacterium]